MSLMTLVNDAGPGSAGALDHQSRNGDQPTYKIVRRAAVGLHARYALVGKGCAVNRRTSAARPLHKESKNIHYFDDTVASRCSARGVVRGIEEREWNDPLRTCSYSVHP